MNALPNDGRPAEILLIEDSEGDVLLLREAFKRTRWRVNVHAVAHGRAGLAFLRKEGDYAAAPSPDLIFLDLVLPDVGGREVMAEIAADARLRPLPVVVLSADQQAVGALYRLRCSMFVVKPMGFNELQRLIQASCDYWFGVAAILGRAGQ